MGNTSASPNWLLSWWTRQMPLGMTASGQSRQFRHVQDWSADPQTPVARPVISSPRCLDRDPLDLIERYGVAGAVVELGRPRALMRRHGLCILERAAGLEIGGDARRPEHMAPELDPEPGFGGAAADHAIGVDAVHRRVAEAAGPAERAAEEGGLAVVTDAGRHKVVIDVGLELVVRRHFMALAAFLMEAEPPALAFGIIVVDAH